jgi:hypothetical protein
MTFGEMISTSKGRRDIAKAELVKQIDMLPKFIGAA